MAEEGLNFGGIFAKKGAPAQNTEEANSVIRDVTRRLRVMEERMASDRKNIQLTQQNTMSANKSTTSEIKNMYTELSELKKELTAIKDQMNLVVSGLTEAAKKEEVKVLEKYIELWEPLNFVTKREVEATVRRAINEIKGK